MKIALDTLVGRTRARAGAAAWRGRLKVSRAQRILRDLRRGQLPAAISSKQETVDSFHRLHYDSDVWRDTVWLGVTTLKCPLDVWVYQEILTELKPDLIVETGTANGGSAYFLASICDLLQHGQIVTIDVNYQEGRPNHERIHYILGSSTAPEVVDQVSAQVRDVQSTLVILDSAHSKDHVLRELELYSSFVTLGGCLIVEDTNINGHPVLPGWGPGPMEAIEDFLRVQDSFVIDRSKEKFFMTFNPKGYLRRIR